MTPTKCKSGTRQRVKNRSSSATRAVCRTASRSVRTARAWPSSGRGRRTRRSRCTTPTLASEPPALEGVVQAETGSRPQPVFSPDGRRLTLPASGSQVRVWDADAGLLRYTARGHAITPAVGFLAGGTRLLTAGRDGTVKEWTEPAPRPTLDGLDASDALADRLQRLFAADFTSGTDWREMSRTFSPLAFACTPTGLRAARAYLTGEIGKASLEIRIWDEKSRSFRALSRPPFVRARSAAFLSAGTGRASSPSTSYPPPWR